MREYKCDHAGCEHPVTSMAVDMLRHEPPGCREVEFSPIGQIKYGCDLHPAKSVEIPTTSRRKPWKLGLDWQK